MDSILLVLQLLKKILLGSGGLYKTSKNIGRGVAELYS